MLTLQQVEDIAKRLRKYNLTYEDAAVLGETLAGATTSPVPVLPADVASLMRPRRAKPPKQGAVPEVQERRRLLRESILDVWPSEGFDFVRTAWSQMHHEDDYGSLKSAVQYRARKDGFLFSIRRVSETCAVITLDTRS